MATLATYALTTLADVKENLGIPSSNHSKDNLIIRKINQATAMIERYCGRRFKATNYVDEPLNGSGTNQLVLKQRPVIGTLTLNARDTSLNEDDFEAVDSELMFVDDNSGVVDLLFTSSKRWGSFTASYRGGYETIPDDLAEACASLAAFLVTNADTGSVNVQRKREGAREVHYSNGVKGGQDLFMQLGIDDTINSYANSPVFADH